MSGTEPLLNMDKWATPKAIGQHNCYAHAFDDFYNSPVPVQKQQPGDRSGNSNKPVNLSTCDIADRVLADNPGLVYRVKAETPCRPGHHKVFLFNDPNDETSDYHFMRQVKDMVYRRKPGETLNSLSFKFDIHPGQIIPISRNRVLLKNVNIFSHKMGFATGALVTDCNGKIIKDPRYACRTAGSRNYSLNCGSFCVKSGQAKTRKDSDYIRRRTY